jgi:hypothetical protein
VRVLAGGRIPVQVKREKPTDFVGRPPLDKNGKLIQFDFAKLQRGEKLDYDFGPNLLEDSEEQRKKDAKK